MKYIIGIILGILIAVPAVSFAESRGGRSEWWSVKGGSVERIYDKENKLVCWIYSGGYKGGISCVPSLELDNPLYK